MSSKTNKIQHTFKFSSFTESKAQQIFQLEKEFTSNLLDSWFEKANEVSITSEEIKMIEKLHAKLRIYVTGWNEHELTVKFIVPLIETVNFDNHKLRVASFTERTLNIQIKNTEIKGIVDLMVATGVYTPEHPFFFVHEYKKEQESSGDAIGQLLATMFVAQELNKKPHPFSLFETSQKTFEHVPIYGIYVIGRLWFFVRLAEQKYHISNAYDSVKKADLLEIFKLLKAQKEMIVKIVTEK
ncbi:MAG: hypothetical protein ACPGVB_04045 [Chitinophagales bacterium]